MRHRLCHSLRHKTRREPLAAVQKARSFNDFRWMKSAGMEIAGGERGIRTLGTLLTYTRFPGVRLQPLGHLSNAPSWKARHVSTHYTEHRSGCKSHT